MLFHFALVEGGILLLGNFGAAGTVRGRFEVVSKTERVFRHIGRARPGELGFLMQNRNPPRLPPPRSQSPAPGRQSAVAEFCRRLVIENYAPAAVL